MVDPSVLRKAEKRLSEETRYTFYLGPIRRNRVEVEVYDPSYPDAGRRAIFSVPLSKHAGLKEVVRRVSAGFDRYGSLPPVYREPSALGEAGEG
ncbi:MAG TPA: hypothetical protein VGG32_07065 [Thermoplasmata archaeon]|jgi:hypothetical protein